MMLGKGTNLKNERKNVNLPPKPTGRRRKRTTRRKNASLKTESVTSQIFN